MTGAPMRSTMTFTHLCAWRVIGGIGMPAASTTVDLATGAGWSYALTNDIDAVSARCDRKLALAHLTLQGIFSPEKIGTLDERLAAGIVAIQAARRQRTRGGPWLVFLGSGQVDVTIGRHARQHADFILTWDAYDKGEIRSRYAHQHRAIQLALALESKTRVRFEEDAAGTFCIDAAGTTVYSLDFSAGNAEMIVSRPLQPEAAAAVATRFALLHPSTKLGATLRHFCDMATYGREPFRVFSSGWAGLETLINTTFREHEARFLTTSQSPHQAELAAMYRASLREKTMGKYSMLDKFLLVSAVLLPEQSTEAALADVDAFKEINNLRNNIAHGAEFDEGCLPVRQLSELLLKYLAAHTGRSNIAASIFTEASQSAGDHV